MESSLQKELERTRADKEKFVAEFSEEDYNYIVNGWQVGKLLDVLSEQLYLELSKTLSNNYFASRNMYSLITKSPFEV